MTTEHTEASATTEDQHAVGSQVERGVRPYATSVTWRNDQGGSWQQWHDDEDPMPDEWDEAGPPDEVVHVYSAAQVEAMLAAERERCANVVRYWLAGHAPADGSYEARCLEHLLDGRPASAWAERV